MKAGFLAPVLALSALCMPSAEAELEHSYNFLDFGYERTLYNGDFENYFNDAHGFAADLAISPVPGLLFAADFHFARPDQVLTDEGVNMFDLRFGAGGYYPINDKISLYAHVGPRYIKAETQPGGLTPSDWGIYVEPGIRVNLTGNLEVYGAYEYSSNFDAIHAGKVGAVFHFSEALGIELFGRFSESLAHSIGAGIRFSH